MAPSRSSNYHFPHQYFEVKRVASPGTGAEEKVSVHLAGRGAAQPAVETAFCLQTLQGERITSKTVKKMGGGGLANCTFLNRVVSQKNTWKGFAGGFCEVRASSLYPILSRLVSVTG